MTIKRETVNIKDVEKDKSVLAATLEEALTATGFGRYNFGLLLICSWTLQAMGMDLFGSSFVVAAAVCDLQLSMQERALLTATPFIGVVIGAQLWGYVSDTKGRRLTLVLSMSVGFVFAALSSFAPDWRTMALLKLLSSTFTSASNSGTYTLLGESCSESARSRSVLLCSCSLMCAQGVVAVLAYPILPLNFSLWIDFLGIHYRPWRLLALVMSIPCAATACILQFFHESPMFLFSRGQSDEALKVLKKIYACNTGRPADEFPVKKLVDEQEHVAVSQASFLKAMWQQTRALFRPPLLRTTLKLFYLVCIIYLTGSGFTLWLPYVMNQLFLVLDAGGGEGMNLCTVIRYSTDVVSANTTGIVGACNDTVQETTLFSAMAYGALAGITNLVLSLTCGARKRFAMIGLVAMSAVSTVLLNVVAVPIAGGVFFLFFLLCGLGVGILSLYFVELYPTSLRGMASCLSVMLGRCSAFLGANVAGVLISTNCEATFYGCSALLLTAIVFSWMLPSDKKPVK